MMVCASGIEMRTIEEEDTIFNMYSTLYDERFGIDTITNSNTERGKKMGKREKKKIYYLFELESI